MSEPGSIEQIRRHLLEHARMLRSAGIEWMSLSAPLSTPALAETGNGSIAAEPGDSITMCRGSNDAPVAQTNLLLDIAAEGLDSPGSRMSLEERLTALHVLAAEVKGCTRCAELCSTRTQTVFGQGRPGVEVCFIGEAPGADEDAQGLPFVGAAGQLLNRIIAACGWQREEVYICNILKCRPPGNRTPLANEAANCRGFLERQLELVQPKYIVALGGCAAGNLLNTTVALGKLRGRFHDWRGIPVMVTYHPAFLLPHRSPAKKREVWEDMKMLLTKMGRTIPRQGTPST